MGCMNAPEKHESVLQAVSPVTNKFNRNEPYQCHDK